jgi:molybdopterin/thiamine biosynthesis adenylyltransferase
MDGDRQPILSDKVKNDVLEGIFSRTLGVLSKDILTKRVLVVGIGSVGSYISEQLIRSGVGQLTVIDPDIVEYSNLSRTIFTLPDVGKPKVEGLTHKLYQINPMIKLQTYHQDIHDFDAELLKEIFTQADVVVAATDDPGAQRVINRFAYGTGKPAVFIGLYQGAEGGEVILSIPEKTACYQCCTSIRHELEQNAGEVGIQTDYGTGKLEGVIALAADIHHVSSAAVKMILSMLVPEESNVKLKGFASEAVDKEFSYLTFSMKDQYWFYPHLFDGVPGQHAYQSVWLTPTRKEDCPICGKVEERTGLNLAPVTTPSAESIRKAFK